MKTLEFKNILPFAIAIMGIGGAFVTTSMQNASEVSSQIGFTRNAQNQCTSIQVECNDTPKPELCRVSGTTGAIAYEKDNDNNCVQPLYRPF